MPLPVDGLDRTQLRILGCLMEKELAVPESYPLTEAALLAACNQKSNRDPEMGLEPFELQGALHAMMGIDWVKSTAVAGGRTTRYAHRLEEHFAVSDPEKAILCELLVRGPQAPGALKARVARLGYRADPAAIEACLRGLAARGQALVEMLPKRPRERDHRWRHLLGAMDASHGAEAGGTESPLLHPAGPASPATDPGEADLAARITALEEQVARLSAQLRELGGEG